MPVNFSEYGSYEPYNPLQLAEEVIRSTYGDVVSVAKKRKYLRKFGKYTSLGTSLVTVSQLGDETYATGNSIDKVSSSSTADVGIPVTIEGHTVSGLTGDLTFVVQTATLNGQNKVTLTTPLHRSTRVYNSTAAGTNLVGDIYVYEDTAITAGVPDDLTKAHVKIEVTDEGNQQSEKASTSISSVDYWIITGLDAYVSKKTSATADFHLEVRTKGNVWRIAAEITSDTGGAHQSFDPPLIVPPNSDVRVRAKASTTNVEVYCSVNGYLASILG